MADSILIEQVLVNLMKNGGRGHCTWAQRPPAQRSVELRVVQRHGRAREVVEFAIQDTGQGLPPEVLDRLFEAFFSHQERRHGHGPEPVPQHCRVAPVAGLQAQNLYNGTDVVGCRFSFWIPLAKHGPNTCIRRLAPHRTHNE